MRRCLCALAFVWVACAADWERDVVFRATFDNTLDAQIAAGDPKIHTGGTDVRHAKAEGRSGDALRFLENTNTTSLIHSRYSRS